MKKFVSRFFEITCDSQDTPFLSRIFAKKVIIFLEKVYFGNHMEFQKFRLSLLSCMSLEHVVKISDFLLQWSFSRLLLKGTGSCMENMVFFLTVVYFKNVYHIHYLSEWPEFFFLHSPT